MSWQQIADVNLNRLNDSLKFAEDYVRFELTDRRLLETVRTTRQLFLDLKKSLPLIAIISQRASERDRGRSPAFDRGRRGSWSAVLLANLSRAKESARILEELLRCASPAHARLCKRIRFLVYDLEKAMISACLRRFNPHVCAILDERYLAGRDLERLVRALVRGGATMLQLRAKTMNDRAFHGLASQMRRLTARTGVTYIVNDRVAIAHSVGADGVHLGQQDLPIGPARTIMGDAAIIGISVTSPREARKAAAQGADYLGAGAVFPTPTKPELEVIGLDGLRAICRCVDIPVIAIGGIDNRNARAAFGAGARGVAVVSYACGNAPEKAMRALTGR